MLKVVVFDCGYGGEFFADRLAEVFPVLEIIRVIDWRNADKYLVSRKKARELSLKALRPYIGKVDMIVLANHLLSITSLSYYRKRFKNQHFVGLELKQPDTFVRNNLLVLTTKAVTRTLSFRSFTFHLKKDYKTLALDSWPSKIDDGVLSEQEIKETLFRNLSHKIQPMQEIVLACSQFNDIKNDLKHILGNKIKIYDSFDDTIHEIARSLKIRGGDYI